MMLTDGASLTERSGQSGTASLKNQSSIVYDAMRSQLPMYERNKAWVQSRDLKLES